MLAIAGSLIFWIVGTPFDGWSRSDERHVRTVCTERGGTERFCDCIINELQQEGVGYEEINPENGRQAGFVCGAFFQF